MAVNLARAIKSTSLRRKEDKMDLQVKQFLEQYERANASCDLAAIGTVYADIFMFAGPKGVQAVKKDDFLKVIPKMKAHFAQLGLSETRLHSIETTALDSKYVLAKTAWNMTIQDSNGHAKNLDALATYILERKDAGNLTIVVQIDHQDLATAIETRNR